MRRPLLLRRPVAAAIPGVVAVILSACAGPAPGPKRVLLVTTTTVEASGLLDTLVAAYHDAQDLYRVSATAVGSGAALELGRRGDADLLLTHDSIGEALFMEEGHGAEQGLVMENEFILAGPAEDPAEVRGMTDLGAAFIRVARADATFISRADESGTHRMERRLWGESGRAPGNERPAWHVEAGSGMEETLRIASERGAYVLTDDGTFRHLAPTLRLEPLVRGDPPVANRYRYTLPLDPRNADGARHLLAWLLGPGQQVIGAYGVDRFGEPLFRPIAERRPAAARSADTPAAPPPPAPAAGG